jgi:signal transduction histidine kinase
MREVSTRIVVELLEYLASVGESDTALRAEFPHVFAMAAAAGSSGGDAYIGWEQFAPFTDAYVALLERAERVDGCLRFLYSKKSTWLGALGSVLGQFADAPTLFTLMAQFIGRSSFRNARGTIRDLPSGKQELTVTLTPTSVPCPGFFRLVQVGLEQLPELIGRPRARVELAVDRTVGVFTIDSGGKRRPLLSWRRWATSRAALRDAYQSLLASEAELARTKHDLERRFEARTRELVASRDLAESASRAKSAFLANLSHELRTPLTAILGFVDLLGAQDLAPETRRPVEAIERNGRHLLELINDLLNLAVIESGQLSVRRGPVKWVDELNHVVGTLRPSADGKAIALTTRIAAGVPDVVETDPLRLRQILLNLIGNGIKFTAMGGVEVAVDATTRDGTALLRFNVADSGPGIPAGMSDEVFTAFVQGDSSLSRQHNGVGLGLSVARHLARALGGDVELGASTPGTGSVFVATVATGALA